jgi:hypothetical protein
MRDAGLELFEQRVDEYLRLRDAVARLMPPADRDDIWSVLMLRQQFGLRLSEEREGVGEGNLFGGPAGSWFRRRTAECALTPGFRAWLAGRESQPQPRTYVNERFPLFAEHDVPASLLRSLPDLPAELKYRIVGADLVIWDEGADLVIDVLRDAFIVTSI